MQGGGSSPRLQRDPQTLAVGTCQQRALSQFEQELIPAGCSQISHLVNYFSKQQLS